MKLQLIKSMLFQTEVGSLLMDNADISEPIPTLTGSGMVQNFFLYMVDQEAGCFSAPFARVGILPEEERVVYYTSCYDHPFSRPPETILKAEQSFEERCWAYEDYERKYNAAENLFYRDCSESEKIIVQEYAEALQRVTDPVLYPFYEELVPEFFDWLRRIINGKENA